MLDAATGAVLRERRFEEAVHAAVPSPDERTVAVQTEERLYLLDPATLSDRSILRNPNQGGLNSVAWSPDGQILAAASRDRSVAIFRTGPAGTGDRIGRLVGHADFVYSIAWSPDGARIATGSGDRTVQLWDPRDFRNVARFVGHGMYVFGLAWSPDGTDRKSTRLNSSHIQKSRMPSSA